MIWLNMFAFFVHSLLFSVDRKFTLFDCSDQPYCGTPCSPGPLSMRPGNGYEAIPVILNGQDTFITEPMSTES